jgi:NTE family protein
MSRALVLGGGGPVGIGWESGLAVGLAQLGIDLRHADLILGTSAGSVVGAELALGLDLAESLDHVTGADAAGTAGGGGTGSGSAAGSGRADGGGTGSGSAAGSGMEALMAAMVDAAAGASSPEDARRTLGRLAVESPTFDEELFVALFGLVAGTAWPEGYACTAVDVETGEPKLWDRAAGVPLDRAVASSCAVPAVFPPITIDGRRYMDGGMRTALNSDLAAGHDRVVAVSCFVLSLPPGMSDPMFDAMAAPIEAEFDTLRSSGANLEVIVPGEEFLEVSGWGLNLMDFGRARDAYAAGLRQAEIEAGRIRAVWG